MRWRGPGGEVLLRDAALSVSAPHGRTFMVDGHDYGHVIDPHHGHPVRHTVGAGVTGPNSLVCDALSTALLVGGAAALPLLAEHWPEYRGWTAAA